jgi:uncharacterized membrane protein YeaQ/YmgE (transglycosylase-associated protein family)
VLGYLLIGVGGALWLAAVISVLRDQRTTRRRRFLTAAILAACVPAAILYWLFSAS